MTPPPLGIAIEVVAHPDREPLGRALAAHLCGHMHLDRSGLGCEANHLRALRHALEQTVDWVVVLEDDAQPVDNLRAQLRSALRSAPANVVSLYLGTGTNDAVQTVIRWATHDADERGRHFIRGDALMAGVGYAVHAFVLRSLVDYLSTPSDAELPQRITRWAQANEEYVAYTWPSLVDHDDGGYSTIAQAQLDTPRQAHRVGTREQWEPRHVPLPCVPGWSACTYKHDGRGHHA